MRTSLHRRAVRGFYLAKRGSVSRRLLGPPEGVERQGEDLLACDLDGAEVAGPGHDPAAPPRGRGERPGVLGACSTVALAADVGDGGERHRARVAAGVQEAVGGPEAGAEGEEGRPPQRGHAPRPLQEVRGDVLEHGSGYAPRPAEGEMGPAPAGAHPPYVQGQARRPLAQEIEAFLDVAVEES